MSWQVEGRTYHNRDEYLRVLRERDNRQAREEAGRASRQVSELQDRIRRREADLDRARADINRQIRITEEIRTDVQQLHRAQVRLQQAQAAMETQMNAEFAEVRGDIREVQTQVGKVAADQQRDHCEIVKTQAELAQLEKAHQEHVRTVQRTFQEVRQELQHGLQEAEERRRRTEERLQSEIRHVDQKVEEDRRARLAQIQSEIQRAEEATVSVEQTVREMESDLGPLDLEEPAQSIREQIAQARTSIERKDPASALAIANAAFGQARALRYSVNRRQAALTSRKSAIEDKSRELISAAGDAQLTSWFPAETRDASGLLRELLEQSPGKYRQYSRLEIQSCRDEEILDRLQQQIDLMAASAPNIAEQAKERETNVKAIVEKLRRIYGPITGARQYFAKEGDPKSTLVVQCQFGGAKVDVHVGLDGSMNVDAYGHDSNSTCSAKAKAIMAEFGREQQLKQEVSLSNRTEPAVRRESVPPVWNRVAGSLQDIRRKM